MEVRVLLGAAVAVAALLLVPTAPAAIAPLRWCGNDLAQSDRVHDRMGGEQIHVIYALPSDGPDRFAELASPIATDVAAIDAWWRREDPSRAPRFDLFDFPGCESRFGNLDLSFVRLPDPTSVYLPDLDRFQRIATQLAATPFVFAAPDKKYLVFYDGVVADDRVCGTGAGGRTTGGQLSYAIVYLRSGCDLTIGDGGGAAYVGAHELLHALGALPPGAPHPCPGDDGHPCDSSVDVLATVLPRRSRSTARPSTSTATTTTRTAAPWFDLQDSRWLLHAAGAGAAEPEVSRAPAIVTSGVNGQECESVVHHRVERRHRRRAGRRRAARVRLRLAGPARAPGTSDSICFVELGATTEAGVVFRPLRRLALQITGRGTVASSDVTCSRSCSTQRVEGTRAVLRAKAAKGWRFVRWSGACRGTRPTCTLQVGTGGAKAGAVFARRA